MAEHTSTAPPLVERRNTKPGVQPFDEVEWESRTATITGEKGETVFSQRDVEVPKFWSQMATNVVASKYFTGQVGTAGREASVRQLVGRVAGTIADWGRNGGYFASPEEGDAFEAELAYLTLHQKAAFNSPVWFNVGVEAKPQCSACFINSVEDTMESILGLAKTEGMLFKFGSGTGTNLSPLRSSREYLSRSSGKASGPVSFMKGYDAFAGVIKSGGKTRRAAKMVILNADHPDIADFITSKTREERKAYALIAAGYDPSLDGEAYSSVFFQNANHSVRVSDAFMRAVEEDDAWRTRLVTTGETADTYRARELMRMTIESAWGCGDPGMQFDDTVNAWHTCSNTARINASNPCSEYMFLDNSACNLASLNLMKFRTEDGEFDVEAFVHAVTVMITAMEIIVDNASYPTDEIARNSRDYRPLGLGYANLGALLMARGLPYDSDEGRAYAGAITALLTGGAYKTSAMIAAKLGPFADYERNREPMLEVIRKHGEHVAKISARELVPADLYGTAERVWEDAAMIGETHGFRNAQASVLAPTGTIAFMMDCDTTGVEPDIALVKYKRLVGGGILKIVNATVPEALDHLGYDDKAAAAILDYIDRNGAIEGAPGLREAHLPIFDCAFKPAGGVRSIAPMGHVKMMAAVQPFISGAISKTINMPNEATADDIERVYAEAWKLGLKAIAIYRDGCKQTQPLSTSGPGPSGLETAREAEPEEKESRVVRRRLPDERQAITHKFSVAGHEGYITVGMYKDVSPGEIFIVMAKEGSTVSGLMDSFATAISLALQYGVPLKVLVDKFSHTRFEPSGFTKNPQVPIAKSIMDYIFRWLALKFLPTEERPETDEIPALSGEAEPTSAPTPEATEATEKAVYYAQADAPICHECGAMMVRNGTCYRCLNCGATSGCS
jgi:ribonucleoside-diphosphate reductase alpha chain